jgi:hypothetical protein
MFWQKPHRVLCNGDIIFEKYRVKVCPPGYKLDFKNPSRCNLNLKPCQYRIDYREVKDYICCYCLKYEAEVYFCYCGKCHERN